ncbi:hypothetical protein FISHEDRAFT_57719 [Fistulina hepatica ATCC 64428]|uniref:Uncharacterized protein n=1 Tax=Fistulina hepatica ATCC 64428 TaxID=1128425 RepID=A0A0D7AG13_9AGAR|nr:hypothetical protein FISHEDRAFT_57719 [Fistulina hepatica ATCC 64428]
MSGQRLIVQRGKRVEGQNILVNDENANDVQCCTGEPMSRCQVNLRGDFCAVGRSRTRLHLRAISTSSEGIEVRICLAIGSSFDYQTESRVAKISLRSSWGKIVDAEGVDDMTAWAGEGDRAEADEEVGHGVSLSGPTLIVEPACAESVTLAISPEVGLSLLEVGVVPESEGKGLTKGMQMLSGLMGLSRHVQKPRRPPRMYAGSGSLNLPLVKVEAKMLHTGLLLRERRLPWTDKEFTWTIPLRKK